MIMVDWISATIHLPHDEPLNGGNLISIDRDGSVDWTSQKWLSVKGSYSSSVQIRSCHDGYECSHISFSGNPVKFLQGHNIFGSSNIHGLLSEALYKVFEIIGFPGKIHPLANVLVEIAKLTRIDLTASYHLANQAQVQSWLRSAEFSANLRHRGKGSFTHGTLYFGKHSRRWSLKFYSKGVEVRDNKKHQIPLPDSLIDFADKSLRCELTLRSKELDRIGLSSIQHWLDDTPETIFNDFCSRLEMTDNMKTFSDSTIEQLPPRLVGTYRLWKDGADLREIYSKSTFYRYRKELKSTLGIDILVKQNPHVSSQNVIPLIQVLEAKTADIPDWAIGTNFYFDPRSEVPWGNLNKVACA